MRPKIVDKRSKIVSNANVQTDKTFFNRINTKNDRLSLNSTAYPQNANIGFVGLERNVYICSVIYCLTFKMRTI